MKKIFTLMLGLWCVLATYAQAPQKMNYQAVVRNASGQPVASGTQVALRFTIHNGTANGTVVYTETQTATANQFGLVAVELGTNASLATVNWGNGDKYLQVEADVTGGTNYTDMGTSQLLSVPFALYAANSAPGPQGPQGVTGPQGPVGATGAQGAQGIAGVTGATGNDGAQGPIGLQGATGATGDAGPQGVQGVAGAQGPAGATGNAGVQGVAGATGPQGDTGAQGPQGLQGVQGIAGPTGDTGLQGPQGIQGLQGVPGPQGIQGVPGPAGSLGTGTAVGNTTFWDGSTWVLNNSNIYNAGGNVGIGTVNPGTKLHVAGDIFATGVVRADGVSFLFNGGFSDGTWNAVMRNDGGNAYLYPWGTGNANNTVVVGGGANTHLTVTGNLQVNGAITNRVWSASLANATNYGTSEVTLVNVPVTTHGGTLIIQGKMLNVTANDNCNRNMLRLYRDGTLLDEWNVWERTNGVIHESAIVMHSEQLAVGTYTYSIRALGEVCTRTAQAGSTKLIIYEF